MLKHVKQYNNEANSQIEVTNRNSQVVEERIILMNEKSEKKKHDYLIDNKLEEQVI